MPIYTMEVVCQVLTITADNEEQAEAKYDAHFNYDEECPCGVEDCDCVDESDDCYHITTEEKETVSCGACGLLVSDVEEHWDDCDENPNSNPDHHFVNPTTPKILGN